MGWLGRRDRNGSRGAGLLGVAALLIGLVLVVTGCGGSSDSSSSSSSSSSTSSEGSGGGGGGETTSMKLVLAWYPTPEYGGLYAAVKEGYFEKEGLDVSIKPGGPQVSATTIVGSGQADIGYLNSDVTMMEAWDQGIELTEFATTYQKYPEAVEYHEEHPIKEFKEMEGKTVSAVTGSVDYEWLQHKYELNNKVTPFSYATFAHDDESLLVGYAPDDVPSLAAEGVKIGYLPLEESGFAPYADVLFAKTSYVEEHEAEIKKFLKALGEGWAYYRNHAPEINKVITEAEPNVPAEINEQISELQDEFIYGGDAETNGIGTIDAARVKKTYEQVKELGLLKSELDLSKVANTTLMPKIMPPAKEG
jgi:NitT/TauT family transport system substrate-binding protein